MVGLRHGSGGSQAARLPLAALRAFEAAVRFGSMSAAALQLGVTHGAVSRHVKGLETRLGLPLLRRLPRSVEPTPEGRQLAAELADAFDRISLALSRLEPGPLTLSCSATVMMFWLLPRLGRFKAAHPGVDLRLDVNHGEVDFLRDGISLAIRNTMYQKPPGAIGRPLIREEIGPVCHPDYAARLRPGLGGEHVGALAGQRILGTRSRPKAWAEWLAAVADDGPVPEPLDTYEHFYLVIQAAACGLGLAIAPRILVETEIAAGHLVAPFGFVPGPHSLELWIAEHLNGNAEVQALVDWLRREIRPRDAPPPLTPGTPHPPGAGAP